MPFHSPNPDSERKVNQSSGLQSLVQAERLVQIAFVLPCSMLIGWAGGWWIDKHFHTEWATIAGLIFGLIAGMVSVIRMALGAGKPSSSKGSK